MRIVTDNKNNQLQEHKDHLLKRKHKQKQLRATLSQNDFNLGNREAMTKNLFPLLHKIIST